MSGPIARASAQIEEAWGLQKQKEAPRRRLNRTITLIDSILGSLEDLNLKGMAPVPGRMVSSISSLLHAIPSQYEISIVAARSTEELMDELLTVQQRLLAMRAGPSWEWAYADEECRSGDRLGVGN